MISKGEGGGRGFSVKMLPVRLRRVISIELISTICEKKVSLEVSPKQKPSFR